MPACSGGVVCKWTNKDKEDHHLDKKRGPLGFAYPSRIIVCGKQNCGKGVTAINIACTAEPPYETVRVWHYAPEHTKEWEDMDAKMVGECPVIEDFPKDKKNLLIIDDIDLVNMSRKERGDLDRLFGYISTHASCTIILCTQDFASVPISVRRKSTHWVLFPSVDYSANRHVSQATGHSFKQLAKLCKTKHDSICFDMSGNGEADVFLKPNSKTDFKIYSSKPHCCLKSKP